MTIHHTITAAWTWTEIQAWAARTPSRVAAPKLDGVAVELAYQDGLLIGARTRGIDVTAQLRACLTVEEQRISLPGVVVVGAEVVMRREDYEALPPSARRVSPRHQVGAALRSTSPSVPLHVVAHTPVSRLGRDTASGTLSLLRAAGLPTVEPVDATDLDAAREHVSSLRGAPYDLDGVVYSADRYVDQDDAGSTATAPRWATAWKW